MPASFWARLDGAVALQKSINKLGALPKKVVTPAAKKGATIWLKAVKANAPEDTGTLKSGIILKGEKTNKQGKKVYEVTFDRAMNDVFAKTHTAGKNASAVRNKKAKVGDSVRAYYPASQEFGFFNRDGSYTPGYHFMKKSAESNMDSAEAVIVSEMTKNIDKEWAKKNG